MRLPRGSTRGGRSSASGGNGFSTNACRDLRSAPGPDAPGLSPPEAVVQVKAPACELPANPGLPLSRMSIADVAREVRRAGIVASISDKTVWRWLHEDAIRPWQHRCWIFPRDPDFRVKAGADPGSPRRALERNPLRDDEFVISTDEKTSIQARQRTRGSLPTAPRQAMRIEHEYVRRGAMGLPGRPGCASGQNPWDPRTQDRHRTIRRLLQQVMTQEPYRSARRVFWDHG